MPYRQVLLLSIFLNPYLISQVGACMSFLPHNSGVVGRQGPAGDLGCVAKPL